MTTETGRHHFLLGRAGRAVAALWWLGAMLAATTGALSLAHRRPGYAALYAAVATGLAALAIATRRGARVAEVISLVGLGSQLIGVVGAGWELFHLDETNAKARHLADLGVSFRLAIVGNLLYSAAASALFLWALVELRRRRHQLT